MSLNMFWVLKRTVSLRRSLWAHTTHVLVEKWKKKIFWTGLLIDILTGYSWVTSNQRCSVKRCVDVTICRRIICEIVSKYMILNSYATVHINEHVSILIDWKPLKSTSKKRNAFSGYSSNVDDVAAALQLCSRNATVACLVIYSHGVCFDR